MTTPLNSSAEPVTENKLVDLLSEGTVQLVEGTGDRKGRVFVRGEFGRSDKATANKRLYPESVWKMEFDRLGPQLKQKKVLGELDHPCFTSDAFQVLTVEGWKPFRAVRVGDKVWSRLKGRAVVSTVEAIVDEPYVGDVLRIHTRSIDTEVTPAHKFLTLKRPDQGDTSEVYVTAEELSRSLRDYGHSPIPKTALFERESPAYIEIPGYLHAGACKVDVKQPLRLPSALFAAFLGIYLAEGHVVSDKAEGYGVFISQKNSWSKELIWDEILSRFPAEVEWSRQATGFYVSDARLWSYLRDLGDQYSRYVPSEAKRLDSTCLKELVYWFAIGDGRMVDTTPGSARDPDGPSFKSEAAISIRKGRVPYTRSDVFSVSERLIRDLHECVTLAGGSGTLSCVYPEKDYEFAGHTIRAENKVPLYQMHLAHTDAIWLDPRFAKIDRREHDGNIFCLSVTHGNFYVEQNGKSFWTGNSDGRTSLQRVSHVITNLELRDGLVIGEAEILDTQKGRDLKAIFDAGVPVGISSRGYGSTKPNDRGESVVQEDYRLVTFDFVAEPADNTAYPDVFFEGAEIPAAALEAQKAKEQAEKFARAVSADKAEGLAVKEADLREEFAKQLLARLSELKSSVRDQVREELLADPSIGKAKRVLESIVGLLGEFGATEASREAVESRDRQIAELRKSLAEADREIAEKDSLIEKLGAAAKEAGYRYQLERLISGDEDADTIRAQIGDVLGYKSAVALKEAVAVSRKKLSAVRESRLKQRKEIEAREAKLASMTEELAASLQEALTTNKSLALQLYASKRLTNHPQAEKIRAMMESVSFESTDQVDAFLDRFRIDEKSTDDLENVRSRVRSRLGGGFSRSPETLEEEHRAPRAQGVNYNGVGVALSELRKLSGMRS